ncbi:MAG: hypothetical protein ACK5TT_06655, partial [Lysobacteraceae bacterium]
MATAWRWLSRLLMVLLALVALLAAIWTYGRWTSPTSAQHAAIALMQQDEAVDAAAENGFPQMMALPEAPGAFPPAVDCGNAADNHCIATIEATPEASAVALEPFRPNLEAAARALRAPVFRDQRPVVSMGIADVQSVQAVMQLDSLRALDFAAGNTAGALADACTDALATVRWATDPDTLLQGMIGIAAFRDQAMLIADMRRRAPADPLPPSCAALAEPPDAGTEGLLCAAMRGEWRYQQRAFPALEATMQDDEGDPWGRRMSALGHDTDWMLGQTARAFAPACGDAAMQAAREDRAVVLAAAEPRWFAYSAFPNSGGRGVFAGPADADYAERRHDVVAW